MPCLGFRVSSRFDSCGAVLTRGGESVARATAHHTRAVFVVSPVYGQGKVSVAKGTTQTKTVFSLVGGRLREGSGRKMLERCTDSYEGDV